MNIKVLDTIKDYEGQDVVDEKGNPALIRNIITNALNNLAPGEVQTPDFQSKGFTISLKVHLNNNAEVDLTVEERAYILERVAKIYPSPVVNGRLKELFEEK